MPETGTFAGASSRMYEFRDRQTVPTAKPIPRGRRDSKSSSSWVYLIVITHRIIKSEWLSTRKLRLRRESKIVLDALLDILLELLLSPISLLLLLSNLAISLASAPFEVAGTASASLCGWNRPSTSSGCCGGLYVIRRRCWCAVADCLYGKPGLADYILNAMR